MSPNWKWILGGGLVAAIVYFIAKPKNGFIAPKLIVDSNGWQKIKVDGDSARAILRGDAAEVATLPVEVPPLVTGQGESARYWVLANDPTITDAWPMKYYGVVTSSALAQTTDGAAFYRIAAKWGRA
jgi:hypothetical protein